MPRPEAVDALRPRLVEAAQALGLALSFSLLTIRRLNHQLGALGAAAPALAREGYATLAVLAGPDAVGFLRFAAANEDDLELQREAERALSAALAGSGERVPSRSHGVDLPRVARGHRQ